MQEIEVVILGSGIAGLGAALKARELGKESVIFEALDNSGGLLDNFSIDGFRFDNAVHLSFANETKVREIFDKTEFKTHDSLSFNFENDKWLKHPVQNNLFPLSASEKVELISSLLQRSELRDNDYESWLRHQYGNAIAERYPIKYTKKYWDIEANKLSTTWIGNRMRRADINEILFGSYTSETPNTYYTKEMRYPKFGGYKAFIKGLIDESNIELNHKAVKLDTENKIISFSNGKTVRYKDLISSIPLPELVKITENSPISIVNAANALKATSIDLISVGFNKDLVKDLWFYIYDDDILASRAYSPSVKSLDNVPTGCSSLQFEIYTRGKESKFTKEQLIENTRYAIHKMKIAKDEDVIFYHHKHLKYGNVIFELGMEEKRDQVLKYYKRIGIYTIGRFGEWDYLWSNQSLLSGYNFNNSK